MNAELKTRWIEALRSGEFKQGQKQLFDPTYDTYCCLGVLCKIDNLPYANSMFEYNGKKLSLNLSNDYRNKIDMKTWDENRLIIMNDDDGQSFLAIANWIEANL